MIKPNGNLEERLRNEAPAMRSQAAPSAKELMSRRVSTRRRQSLTLGITGISVALLVAMNYFPGTADSESTNHIAVKPNRFVPSVVETQPPKAPPQAGEADALTASVAMTEMGDWELYVETDDSRLTIPLKLTADERPSAKAVRMVPLWQLPSDVQEEIRTNWAAAGYSIDVEI